MGLYQEHRPTRLKDVIGQVAAVKVLRKFIETGKVPQAILFSGPSGCGKTTLGRIIAAHLKCEGSDLQEMNAADKRSIDDIRDIRKVYNLNPMGGKARVWIIDEAHQLLTPSQQALLKMLEDPPRTAYFILCTAEPNRLIKTVQTRCTHIQVRALHLTEIAALIDKVCKKEEVNLESKVVSKIAEAAEGSARKALVILEQVYRLESAEDQLEAVTKATGGSQAIEIARGLLNKAPWVKMAAILREVEEEPETVRAMVLNYATTVLLSGNTKLHGRARLMIEYFSDNFFYSGKAGLVASCYGVLHDK